MKLTCKDLHLSRSIDIQSMYRGRTMPLKLLTNLEVWKISFNLSVQIHLEMEDCRNFGFRDQICRSAMSVPSNIAEGYFRSTSNQLYQFLDYARGSAGELFTQLLMAKKLGYIHVERADEFIETTDRISRMLFGLMKSVGKSHRKKN